MSFKPQAATAADDDERYFKTPLLSTIAQCFRGKPLESDGYLTGDTTSPRNA